MVTYLMDRGPSKGHLFQWKDGSPLTRPEFTKYVKAALVANHESYTGHSFRIGAATAAAQAGIPDSTIKALGWWMSGAFMIYLQMDIGYSGSQTSSKQALINLKTYVII